MKYDELDPETIHVTRPGQDPRFDTEAPIAGGAMEVVGGGTAGPTRRALRRFLREKAALAALVYLLALVVATLTYKWWWPYNQSDPDYAHVASGPVGHHWLGTDRLARDIVARLLAGAGVSLRASFQVVITALLVATPLGLVSGYLGGWFDNALDAGHGRDPLDPGADPRASPSPACSVLVSPTR